MLQRFLVQAVVAAHGGLAGKTVRELQFRTRFSAAIIGVHRQGQRLKMRVGDVELQVRGASAHGGARLCGYRHTLLCAESDRIGDMDSSNLPALLPVAAGGRAPDGGRPVLHEGARQEPRLRPRVVA